MGRHNIISPETWLEVKTNYGLGTTISQLERDYGIPESTIRSRRDKECWNTELRAQVTEIHEKIDKIANSIAPAQMDIVQEELNEILQLRKTLNNYRKGVVKLNMLNLRDALNETNPLLRMEMTSKMKATIKDLAEVNNNIPTMIPTEKLKNDKPEEGIMFYLPDNGRD